MHYVNENTSKNSSLKNEDKPKSIFITSLKLAGVALTTPIWFPIVVLSTPVVVGVAACSYASSVLLYLKHAQKGNPARKKVFGITLPHLPLHPARTMQVSLRLLESIRFYLFGPLFPIVVKYSLKKILSSRTAITIHRDIPLDHRDLGLDVYTAAKKEGDSRMKSPVIIFIFGGAWMTGDKKLYLPMASELRAKGYTVVVPNYTLFPHGTVEHMVFDIYKIVQWTHANIQDYGGDSNNITLMGHSAGAHLLSLTVIHNAVSNALRDLPSSFKTHIPLFVRPMPKIAGIVLIAGVYNIFSHLVFEAARGVEEISAMARVCGHSKQKFLASSPLLLMDYFCMQDKYGHLALTDKTDSLETLIKCTDYLRGTNIETIEFKARMKLLKMHLPKNWWIIHGKNDKTVPPSASLEFHSLLSSYFPDTVKLTLYEVDHTQPIISLMVADSPHSILFFRDLETFQKRRKEIRK